MHFSTPAIASVALPLLVAAAPATRRDFYDGPALKDNFPDPSFIKVNGTYYSFATNGLGKGAPVAKSTDFKSWELTGEDALPKAGAWSTGKDIWAPSVAQLDDGTFVMYYAAARKSDEGGHCIGAATANGPTGPYKPRDEYLTCHSALGGAIDASPFQDADGTRYVVYKIDGNAKGSGGLCGNTKGDVKATPIMLQKVKADGFTTDGDPVQILQNGKYDGPLVEAPSLSRIKDDSSKGGWLYILFFSSSCYSSSLYDTSYAYSTNGLLNDYTDYTKSKKPLLLTGDNDKKLYAPGGLASADDLGAEPNVMWHADEGTTAHVRQMWTGKVSVNVKDRTVSI